MVFYRWDRPLTIKVESRGISWILVDSCGISWTLVESCPLTSEVRFLLGSASFDDEVSESDDR